MIGPIPTGVQVSLGLTSGGVATQDPTQMVWYRLSDHNRDPISISYELVENSQRMANGTLRKYVVARKFMIKTSWKDFPTLDQNLVDYLPNLKDQGLGDSGYAHAAAWIKAFYEGNNFYPVWVKLMHAQEQIPGLGEVPVNNTYNDSNSTTGAYSVYNAFMTTFTYDIVKRRYRTTGTTSSGYDLVNLDIEFTEI